ncbi:MAG: PQQ-binding-like beta-propeller repeat protein [Candidatus Zixiibacteriota bacterium]
MKINKILIISLIFAILLTVGCAKKFDLKRQDEILANDWKYPRSNTESTARIESEFGGQLNLKWKKKSPDSPIGPLAFGAGKLIMVGKNGRICFYNPNDGNYLGRYRFKRAAQTGFLVEDSLGYFSLSNKQNTFMCKNLYNRNTVWDLEVKDVTGTPIILQKNIFFSSALGELFSLDRLTGDIIWRDSVGYKCLSGPSGQGEMIVFPLDNGLLNCYNANSGDLHYSINLGEPLVSKAVIGDRIYISSVDGSMFAVDRNSGAVVWRKNYQNPIWTSPALDQGKIYFGDNAGNLIAVSENDGQILWTYNCDAVILASPIVVGNYVVFSALDKVLYCLDKSSGALASKYKFDREAEFPPISDGTSIYIAIRGGGLFCFGD